MEISSAAYVEEQEVEIFQVPQTHFFGGLDIPDEKLFRALHDSRARQKL